MAEQRVVENTGEGQDTIAASITYRGITTNFSGSPEVVLRSLNQYIAKEIPSIDLAQKMTLRYSLADLAEKFQKFVRITEEGPRVSSLEAQGLSDKEMVALQLVAKRIGCEASTAGQDKDAMSLRELEETTGLVPKTLSSRLSELVKGGFATKVTEDKESLFRITTIGIEWLLSDLAKKQEKADKKK